MTLWDCIMSITATNPAIISANFFAVFTCNPRTFLFAKKQKMCCEQCWVSHDLSKNHNFLCSFIYFVWIIPKFMHITFVCVYTLRPNRKIQCELCLPSLNGDTTRITPTPTSHRHTIEGQNWFQHFSLNRSNFLLAIQPFSGTDYTWLTYKAEFIQISIDYKLPPLF